MILQLRAKDTGITAFVHVCGNQKMWRHSAEGFCEGTLCARCPSGNSGRGCIWQLCCHCLMSLLNPAPLFIPVYSLLATSTALPKSRFVITSLWYTPNSTFRAHLTLWAYPKCRPRSSAGPSLLMAMEIFRSSVDFFLNWSLQLANMLLFFIFPQKHGHSKQQAARRIWLAL